MVSVLQYGQYKVGSSVRLQRLIKQINDDGFGGIEYLCNVPGLVGGAVAMNAGTGRSENRSISDYIVSVDVIIDGTVITMEKDDCCFAYRDSFFKHNPSCIVTSTLFKFSSMTQEESRKEKEKKMRYYKEYQDPSYPNFGSVFSVNNHKIMALVKKLKIGKRVHFSGKTENWIINEGGNFNDAIKAIKIAELTHKLLRKNCVREVIVWEPTSY